MIFNRFMLRFIGILIATFVVQASLSSALADSLLPTSQSLCYLCIGADLPQDSSVKTFAQHSKSNKGNACLTAPSTFDDNQNSDVEWERFLNDFSDGRLVSNINYVFSGAALNTHEASSLIAYDAMAGSVADSCDIGEVPVPAAMWLFVSAIIGFVGLSTRRRI